MSTINLKNINKYYGKNHILKGLDLTIEDGEFMTLLGPSGCGKTTTLRVISGLEKPQSGTIHMDDREIVNAEDAYFLESAQRNLNLVFQSYALWPHMTVFENVAFGLKIKKEKKEVVNQKVMSALERMQIDQYKDRYPSELSGGQQQRVAIARAIVSDPQVLLLDEPLSNLDAKLRVDMRSELKRLHEESGSTIIYVTHDQIEALTMSTKIAVFFEGEMVQVAPPMEIYNNPVDLRVADFIGNPRINFIKGKGRIEQDTLVVDSDLGAFTFPVEDMVEDQLFKGIIEVVLGVRPEQISMSTQATSEEDIKARVYTNMPAGSETLVTAEVAGISLMMKEIGISQYKSNEIIYLNFSTDKMNVFNQESGKLIKLFK